MALKKLISAKIYPEPEFEDKLSVTFRVTEKCNHSCFYCGWHDNSVPLLPKEEIMFMFSQIKKYSCKEKYDLFLTGGEPTIYPDFIDLLNDLDMLFDGKTWFSIQSNTNLSPRFYEQLVAQNYSKKLKISASYQNHQVQDKEKWKQNIKTLNDNKCLANVDLLLERQNVNEVKNMFYHLKEEGIETVLVPIDEDPTAKDDYQDLMDIQGTMGHVYEYKYDDGSTQYINDVDVKMQKLNEYMFMKCDAGYQNIVLSANGDVSICSTHYESMTRKKINLYKDPESLFKLTSKPQVCLWKTCQCEYWLKKTR